MGFLLFSLMVNAQKSTYVYVNSYKNGKAIKTLKVIEIVVPKPSNKIVYVTKTRKMVQFVKVPVKVSYVEPKFFENTQKIDSLKLILAKYETINKKTDVLKLKDSLGHITINDEISHNQFLNRNYEVKINTPQPREIVREVYKNNVEYYAGPFVTTTLKTPFNSFGLSLQRKSRKNDILQLSVGTTLRDNINVPQPIYGFGWFLKIK